MVSQQSEDTNKNLKKEKMLCAEVERRDMEMYNYYTSQLKYNWLFQETQLRCTNEHFLQCGD